MAKMFYTLEEAAAKLGRSADQVKQMADSRQLEVFRSGDRLMFKVDQVDLLSGGGGGGEDVIPLAESGELEPLSLASSGSGVAIDTSGNPKEQTGISIFDADATEDADPSAVTRVSNAPSSNITAGDPGKSGSGLMDLTRGIDETSLGASLLEDVYSTSASADQSAAGGAPMDAAVSSGNLFEGGGSEVAAASPAFAMALAEPYDGAGSGLIGGLAVGMIVTLLLSLAAVVFGITGAGAAVLSMMGDNLWPIVGGLAVLTLVAVGLGWMIGRKS
jgi:hypothetical protein